LAEADFIFISAMIVQKDSAKEIIARCRKLNKKCRRRASFYYGIEEFVEDVIILFSARAENRPAFFADDLVKINLKENL